MATNVVELSDELYRILGMSKDEFSGTYEDFASHIVPPDLPATEQALFAAQRDKAPFSYQHRIVRKSDSAVRMLDTRGEVLTDEEGKPTALIGNCWDITNGWKTRQQLERSVSLLRATLESTADGILVVDSDRRVSAYNERFVEMWRLPPTLVAEHDDVKLLAAVLHQLEDPEAFQRVVDRLYETPGAESHDVLRFADGRIFERYSRPQRIGDDVVGRVWSFRDVTEQEHLLTQVTFIADATRLLASLDYDSALEATAKLAVPLLGEGCAIDLLITEGGPRRIMSVAPGLPSLELPEVPAGVLAGHQVIDNTVAGSAVSVPLAGHEGLLGALTFVSRRERRYGPRDLALIEELGRRVALCVDNARLYHRANEALRARDELLSVTSHEIRGPLSAQLLALQGLDSENLPEATRKRLLQMLAREHARLTRFVDDLVDTTRIRRGQFSFALEEVDLRDVVRDVATRLGPEVASSGSPLSICAEGAPIGKWDRLRLEQVVTNLLSNAIKFGGGKPITVGASARDGQAQLVVSDEGEGIPPTDQVRLFQPFERASSSRHFGGLGLGLYIVRTIAEGLGGSVRLLSARGRGTTFIVELPMHREEARTEGRA